ncbi:MAG: B-box zinc finger protein [Nitrososphaerota archaeon]|nr:hypothetical protein [Candidatus Bathyarchaeota archaeon]MDW8062133.1 B-box zinc finger protein [Nitrososphaerota archaeon]
MVVLCEECGRYQARYVCGECGRRVCALCFDVYSGLCRFCLKERGVESFLEAKPAGLVELPIIMILLGVALTFIGALLIGLSGFESGSVSGGIVVVPFIPIPIGVGFGPYGPIIAILTYIMAIVLFILMIFWWRRVRKI